MINDNYENNTNNNDNNIDNRCINNNNNNSNSKKNSCNKSNGRVNDNKKSNNNKDNNKNGDNRGNNMNSDNNSNCDDNKNNKNSSNKSNNKGCGNAGEAVIPGAAAPVEATYLHEDKLRMKASEYMAALKNRGIRARVAMVRDYMLKLSIEKDGYFYGSLIIDYKATRDSYSVRTRELKDKSIEDVLLKAWEEIKDTGKHPETAGHGGQHWQCLDEMLREEREDGFGEPKYEIYVDGSFIGDTVGYGVVVLKNGRVLKELAGAVMDELYKGSRQVGGEIVAVMEALAWCKSENIMKVIIYHDFENLRKWVDGEYLAKIPMTRAYKEYVLNSGIEIEWKKVAGHSGVEFNERADELAKKGAGSP
ncbi:MAG: hypothetical protein GX754_08085 [Clostridiaceae bacterium]|nr:hypothetical protein [Clostridiaceae bacterium]